MAVLQPDIRQIVDRLLAAQKTLVGEADFRGLDGDNRKQRWRKPCAVAGEVTPLELEVQAYPDSMTPKFRIILIYQKAICRLDFANNEGHINHMNRPSDLEPGPIDEPHFHAWEDNRRFSTKTSLPTNLANARRLPANVRSFDSAFRWFCGQTHIIVASLEVPALPQRVSLL
jgi:hypothetical protein